MCEVCSLTQTKHRLTCLMGCCLDVFRVHGLVFHDPLCNRMCTLSGRLPSLVTQLHAYGSAIMLSDWSLLSQ